MSDLILHHFDASPFAEKIRLVMGLKALAWQSVEIPMVPPKPDLTALTGGYRRTPVLQVGADIYCDTRLIALELERRYPSPTLFPGATRGLALMLASWSDRAFFDPGAALAMGTNLGVLPEPLIADRKAFFNFMDFSRLGADVPHMYTQLRSQLDTLEQALAAGTEFLGGAAAGWADINAYFPVWMLRGHLANCAEVLAPFPRVRAFADRMATLGHGQRRESTAAAALEIARLAQPQPAAGVNFADEALLALGLGVGDPIRVSPDDYGKDPVEGELWNYTLHEVAVRRTDPRAGTVVVHFPRALYRVERA
jgi:glutathione S-transferase